MDIRAQIKVLSNQLNGFCELQNNRFRGRYVNSGLYDNGYLATNSFYGENQSWDPYHNCPPQNYYHDYPPYLAYEQDEKWTYMQWHKEQDQKILEQQKMDEIIQMIQKNTEESVSQNKRLDMQGEKLRAMLTAQSSSRVELQREIESNRKIEGNGGELKVNVEEQPPYVPPIPFPKRLVGCEVAHDIPGDNSPA
ncbi:hypothetical protein LIER_39658 [Lithospermum erythrorhizon]|uniref:Uncharacterized protein n=1 Tax=Lithospermum erythrorhizon TaxID=34254 RepID=A0AAV3QKV9_LITER